jgi:MSHA biogenesis protein MshJ
MIREYWENLSKKVDALSLRERVLIFAAAAFVLVSLVNALFLDPLLAKQKVLSTRLVQQQEKIKAVRAQLQTYLEAKRSDASSPLRQRMSQLKQQLTEGESYIKGRSDRLVPSDKMASVLEQMLKKNGRLQLVGLQTLPVTPLVGKNENKGKGGGADHPSAAPGRQVFKHGVQITVRGNYLDMLKYLEALEHLRAQMFWGRARLDVAHYPVAELTLTVYTLSLDKTWLVV